MESAFQDEGFEQRRASIIAAGCNLQPILVRQLSGTARDVRYELVYGERRLRACQEAGLHVRALVTRAPSWSGELDQLERTRPHFRPVLRRAIRQHLALQSMGVAH